MAANIQVEPLGDHEYLVSFPAGGETVRSQFRATQDTLGKLGPSGSDEGRIVAATAAFLAEHQQVIDLPSMLDLDDVAAAYGGDYLQAVSRDLGLASG